MGKAAMVKGSALVGKGEKLGKGLILYYSSPAGWITIPFLAGCVLLLK